VSRKTGVHRPTIDWEKMENRHNPGTTEGRIFRRLRQVIRLRKKYLAFGGGELSMIDLENDRVLGYVRRNKEQRLILLVNFAEHEQTLPAELLEATGLHAPYTELISGQSVPDGEISLQAYQFACFSNKTMD
jgi:amylosucrase